jgi:hypothetical protein
MSAPIRSYPSAFDAPMVTEHDTFERRARAHRVQLTRFVGEAEKYISTEMRTSRRRASVRGLGIEPVESHLPGGPLCRI